MTQLIINVEDNKILPHLKKILSAIDGVSIAVAPKQKKNGLDKAFEDVKEGRLNYYDNVDNFFDALGI